MSFQPGANLYGVAFGTIPEKVEVPHIENRAPFATDSNYPLGKRWIVIGVAEYVLVALSNISGLTSATWVLNAVASGGALNTLTGDSGGPIAPIANNINISGTAGQITTTGSAGAITLSTPAAFVAPGSITATTTVTATLGNITATNGNLVLGTAGNKIVSTSVGSTATAGANSFGKVTLVNGTVTVTTTAVTTNSIIMLTRQSPGTTGASALGLLSVGTIVGGTSFVINALTTANSTTVVASDESVIGYMIIN